MNSRPIAFVTSNPGKVATANEHLEPLGLTVEQVLLDLDEIQSDSVQTVALHKAQQAFTVLRRPVIVEDSGFFIDELNGFPGPLVRHVVRSLGAEGIARIADLTVTRRCHFEGVLVHIDDHGVPRVFLDSGDGGTVAAKPTDKPQPGAWSALWDVFIPPGCEVPLSALVEDDRARVFDGWSRHSVFTQFGAWLAGPAGPVPSDDARLRSAALNFDFPAERIASRPKAPEDELLLVIDRKAGQIAHRHVTDLAALLPPESLVVVNNSRVVKAALRRIPDDGTYLHVVPPFGEDLEQVTCLSPWKPEVGTSVPVRGGRFVVESIPEPGRDLRKGRIICDDSSIATVQAFFDRYGETPIPIYVNAKRAPDTADEADYQNVFATAPGSVACPTAGLHLTQPVLDQLTAAGHDVVELTLHIGYGTWKSLATTYVDEHAMDAEEYAVSAGVLQAIRAAKRTQRPVVAVGTSCVRTLESCADVLLGDAPAAGLRGSTALYISPPYEFQVVDAMVTNFAYPKTPIMALTAAFARSVDLLFDAYRAAVDDPTYQFFSYGDAMLIL